MTFILISAVCLSMDAFATAISKGITASKFEKFVLSISFGFFQGIMPLIGWIFASKVSDLIIKVDHWIAFIILTTIGAKMIYESTHENPSSQNISMKEVLLLSLATSIDALAVGVTYAFVDNFPIYKAIITIAVITTLLSYIGLNFGQYLGKSLGKWAEIIGGIVLIAIALSILLSHCL